MRKRNCKQKRKFCLEVLAAVMILAVWGIPVLAETACETVNAAEAVERAGETEELPENPVHHCMKEDSTEWSYVYFGSYPQTEVTGSALTEAITGASYDANGDALVEGTKYRRISESDTNNEDYFGDSEYRYFKWERIKWRVLQVNNSTMFAVADQGLDCKNYNEEDTSVTWETCTLRNWLNHDFYETAFDSREQGAVVEQTVVNEDNPEYATEGGNHTTDKVYLLSLSEVMNPDYGFCEDGDAYSASRRVKASDYAHARGVWVRGETDYAGNCIWWLRSPGGDTGDAAGVGYNDIVYRYGLSVNDYYDACVPALHINLSSDLWSMAGDGVGGEAEELPKNPVHHCVKDHTEWSYVYFGSYPQTEVEGGALTAGITGASYDENGDAWVSGTKYRRISRSDTNNTDYFGVSKYRYFKWERIKWRVLQVNNSTMFAAADQGLDCKNYNEEETSVTWETCTLRNWLNHDFYGTAFDSREQGAVVEQTVVNEDGTEGGNHTTDKVYLLSLSEVMNPDYGFCEDGDEDSANRRVKASDYAHARGVRVRGETDYAGNCIWWLRSPGYYAGHAAEVSIGGNVTWDGSVINSDEACVPALHINLYSDLWSMSDDGTSGTGGNGGTGGGNGGDPGNNGNSGISGSSSGSGTAQVPPKTTAIKGKLKAGKKSITVQWKKQTDVSGYQIQYSANKKFKKNGTKIKTVKKPAATKVTIKKLKAGKKYYVRVRTYKTVNGRDYYSGWSKTKNIKTK